MTTADQTTLTAEQQMEGAEDRHPGGRPVTLTRELMGEFARLMRGGNYFETVCTYLDVPRRTAYNWLEAGERGEDANGDWPEAYREFWHTVTRAEAYAEVTSVAALKQAGQTHRKPVDPETGEELVEGDWRATAEFLARRYNERWSKTGQVRHTYTKPDDRDDSMIYANLGATAEGAEIVSAFLALVTAAEDAARAGAGAGERSWPP